MSHGVWRVAGARRAPLNPSLAERDRNVTCEEWLLYDILGQVLPSDRDPYRWRFWKTFPRFNREAPGLYVTNTGLVHACIHSKDHLGK